MTDAISARPVLRVRQPGEFIETIPYLLGFHPRQSLVLVGLCGSRVVVTARVDLTDAPAVAESTIETILRGGATQAVAVVYDDGHDPGAASLPWRALVDQLGEVAAGLGAELADALLVDGQRWWSYTCDDPSCCPPQGRPLPGDASVSAATATYAGLVALPERADVEALLSPEPDESREALVPLLAGHENDAVQAVLAGRMARHRRAAKRAVFAAARDADRSLFPAGSRACREDELCRYAIALGEITIRDAVWVAVDQRRLDGRALWQEMARRLPAPYDAAALFLFGWAHWREGNGTLASIAAERALSSDPAYRAAGLLMGAVVNGVNPHQVPRLRLPRPA